MESLLRTFVFKHQAVIIADVIESKYIDDTDSSKSIKSKKNIAWCVFDRLSQTRQFGKNMLSGVIN